MKKIIRKVLEELGDTQINLGSKAARETIASLVSASLKTKGYYTEYTNSEIDYKKNREMWVCEHCGKNTYDVDFDYIGTEYNHLGCELEHEHNKVFNEAVFGDSKDLTEVKIEKRGGDRRKGDRREYPYNSFVRDKQEQIKARGVIRPKKRVKKKFYEE